MNYPCRQLLPWFIIFAILSSAQYSSVQAETEEKAKGSPGLDLNGYTLVFDEEFNGPLSVSPHGPGTTWIAHTPYGGDFGKAQFTDPNYVPSPFKVENGILDITAWKEPENNKWRSGLLASVDTKGKGFSQALGYFEVCMRLPDGPGVWPAFWLNGLGSFRRPKTKVTEIDVLEEYGVDARIAHQHVHVWNPDGSQSTDASHSSTNQGMTTDFHTYGALIEADYVHFYFDGVEQWKTPTPPEAKEPLYVMVDLALGGGWPIDKTPSPSHLYIKYIRVYALPPSNSALGGSQNIGSMNAGQK
jgi:beta-glucanase (GH16 family)